MFRFGRLQHNYGKNRILSASCRAGLLCFLVFSAPTFTLHTLSTWWGEIYCNLLIIFVFGTFLGHVLGQKMQALQQNEKKSYG